MQEKKLQIRTSLVGNSNMYLVSSGSGSIIFDTGAPGAFSRLKRAFGRWQVSFDSVRLIVISHVHFDHVGNCEALSRLCSAPVLVHSSAYPFLKSGFSRIPEAQGGYGRLLTALFSRLPEPRLSFPPYRAELSFEDRFDLSPYGFEGEVLHTPGHSCDSVSMVLDEGSCFCGDTCFNMPPFLRRTVFPPLADDIQELYESVVRLAESGCERFYPGHGPAFSKKKLLSSIERGV